MKLLIQQHGFSLLEVLVAFVIAALSLAVMYQIFARGLTSTVLGGEYANAVAIAENKLAELGVLDPLEETATSGTVEDKYHWNLIIKDLEPDPDASFASPFPLKEIEFSLTWDARGGKRELLFHTIRPVNGP